jgi:formate hydrogenlyase subunit 4
MKSLVVPALIQFLLFLLIAPLVTGILRTMKARLQTRRGPAIWQPYRDLHKLLRKGMVIPDTASWLFSATPYVVFLTAAMVGLMIPMVVTVAPLSLFGGVLAVVYLLALGRFFMALGGLDAGTPFGGLGSSREMTISAIAEPAMMLAIFTVAVSANSTNLTEMAKFAVSQNWRFLAPSQILAFGALFIVLIAETGRIPVDNPATHLELTMIHEATLLEYSARHLALMEWSAALKLFNYACIGFALFLPWGVATGDSPTPLTLIAAIPILALKLLAAGGLLALSETLSAKLRIFRAPEFLATAFLFAVLGLLVHLLLGA